MTQPTHVTPATEADDEVLRRQVSMRVAEAELDSTKYVTEAIVNNAQETGRWLLATLVLVNAGGAAALLRMSNPGPEAVDALIAFIAGTVLAVASGEAAILVGLASVKVLGEWKARLILSMSTDLELQGAMDAVKPRLRKFQLLSHLVRVFGYASLASFVTGCFLARDVLLP